MTNKNLIWGSVLMASLTIPTSIPIATNRNIDFVQNHATQFTASLQTNDSGSEISTAGEFSSDEMTVPASWLAQLQHMRADYDEDYSGIL